MEAPLRLEACKLMVRCYKLNLKKILLKSLDI